MASTDDLPHLLSLLDDPSPVVREEIRKAFGSLGAELPQALEKWEPPLTELQRVRLHSLLEPERRDQLRCAWTNWQLHDSSSKRLEYGLNALARYQSGLLRTERLPEMLDRLSSQFTTSVPSGQDPLKLAHYLFQELGLKGDRKDYYNPANSDLIQVLTSGAGNPISLTCVYILVASRLDLLVEGCNFPRHFLARARMGERVFLLDCFDGGRILNEELGGEQLSSATGTETLQQPASALSILARILRNLINSHRLRGEGEQADLYLHLLKQMSTPDEGVQDMARYQPGELVRHRRYDYRGVVVDYDLFCSAEEEWYRSNQSQPDRDQPWYRVLVDGTDRITYAAQTSLKPDQVSEEVVHPLVRFFFSRFEGDRYIRNPRPWPET